MAEFIERPASPREPSSSTTFPTKKPRYRSQKIHDSIRSKTRVNIGPAFARWCELKEIQGLRSHAEVATFLLTWYDQCGPPTSTPSKRKKQRTPAPAMSSIAGSLSPDREHHQPGNSEEETVSASEMRCLEDSLHDMSVQEEQNMDMNIEEINDLRNSVIDWTDEDLQVDSDSPERDSSDEDFVPGLRIRTGGALKACPCIESLPVIGADQTVHDIPDVTEPPPLETADTIPPSFPTPLRVQCEEDVIGKHAFILYEDSLRQLASFLVLPVERCPYRCKVTGIQCQCLPPYDVSITPRGSASIMDWTCANGHLIWRWNSQPTLKFGMQVGDFMLACNILLSGNNYAKIALLFKFMNMGVVAPRSFYAIQDTYCVDGIKECWTEKRKEVINRLKDREVVVVGDGRMDSPGYNAQYCTYTIMENESRDIVSIVSVDKRQTQRNSVIMEKAAFVASMTELLTELKVVEVCTDAHVQISALMDHGLFPGVLHSFDMWHGSKNLSKRMTEAAKIKGQSVLLLWIRDVVNHFWWVCKKATTFDEFMELWLGLLHHVANEHSWVLGRCLHEALETSSTKEWLERGSKAHEALTDIIMNKRWLKTVHKYLTFRSTAELESFQNHLLMYTSKRYSFSPPVYEARTLLAALDYNQHKDRPVRETTDGKQMSRRLFKKNAKRWSVYAVKVDKTYDHIPALQARILSKRLAADAGLPQQRPLRPDDPRRLGFLPTIPPPPMQELLQSQVRRGLGPALQNE